MAEVSFPDLDRDGRCGVNAELDTYRRDSLETWGLMAPGWEARREWMQQVTGHVTDWLVERVEPQPGQTVLDIAAGPGELGFRLAERVADGGRVMSTDFAPEMVD